MIFLDVKAQNFALGLVKCKIFNADRRKKGKKDAFKSLCYHALFLRKAIICPALNFVDFVLRKPLGAFGHSLINQHLALKSAIVQVRLQAFKRGKIATAGTTFMASRTHTGIVDYGFDFAIVGGITAIAFRLQILAAASKHCGYCQRCSGQ